MAINKAKSGKLEIAFNQLINVFRGCCKIEMYDTGIDKLREFAHSLRYEGIDDEPIKFIIDHFSKWVHYKKTHHFISGMMSPDGVVAYLNALKTPSRNLLTTLKND